MVLQNTQESFIDVGVESTKNELFDEVAFPDIFNLPVEDIVGDVLDTSRRSSLLSTPYMSSSITPEEILNSEFPSIVTSPFDSPNDFCDASPLFDTMDSNSSNWQPLFSNSAPLLNRSLNSRNPIKGDFSNSVNKSADNVSNDFGGSESPARRDSRSLSESPVDDDRERSESPGVIISSDGSVVGISERKRKRVTSQSYSRRPRAEPLPPIVVEDAEDATAVKRARNTLAARRSRERKMLRLTDLEKQVDELLQERDSANARIKELEKEVARLRGF
ncbi:hypothetical protein V1511DRAFT_458726 [Dipodascopsis uninucleata]